MRANANLATEVTRTGKVAKLAEREHVKKQESQLKQESKQQRWRDVSLRSRNEKLRRYEIKMKAEFGGKSVLNEGRKLAVSIRT